MWRGLPGTHRDGRELDNASPPLDLTLKFLWVGCLGGCLAIFVLGILSLSSYNSLVDDSFMYSRYAYRVATEHRLSWNPHGPPTYGLTAPAYLAPVFAMSRLLPSEPALALWLTSLMSGILFIILLVTVIWRHCALHPEHRRWLLLLLAYAIAMSTPSLKRHFTSGMDTTFAMAYLTAYILFAAEFERRASVKRAVGLGLWGGLAYIARPDLLIFAVVVPVFMFFFAVEAGSRRLPLLTLGSTLAAVVVQIALCSIFLESPLPLPFYAKTTHLYGDSILAVYATMPRVQLFEFCRLHILLIALIGATLLFNSRTWWRDSGSLDKGLLAGSVIFVGYFYFFVLQILGRPQRFYYPVLPALVFLACRCASLTFPALLPLNTSTPPWRRALAFGLFVGMLGLFPGLQDERRAYEESGDGRGFSRFDLKRLARGRERNTWVGLDRFSSLPDDLVIATTEVGLPAALNLDKTVVDLAGLQEPAFARNPFSADRLFTHYHPDLVYMPHPDYTRMTREIEEHPLFKRDYEYFPSPDPRLSLGVAIWRSSPYYSQMRDILSEILRAADQNATLTRPR